MIVGYERVLRFFLRFKIVPIAAALALLVFAVWQVTRMGIVFMPEMGSEQMSATLKMDTEATQDEDYALADKISTQMQKIKGVKTVGVMKGSTSGAMSSANSDKTYSL